MQLKPAETHKNNLVTNTHSTTPQKTPQAPKQLKLNLNKNSQFTPWLHHWFTLLLTAHHRLLLTARSLIDGQITDNDNDDNSEQ
jgi:hypothetical protein